MKRLAAVLTLAALGAAAGAQAQTYSQTPQSSAAPPASTSQREQTTPSKADKQALMKDCLAKVTAANPNTSQQDIKAYCDKEVEKRATSPK
jgi:hypothetical protein